MTRKAFTILWREGQGLSFKRFEFREHEKQMSMAGMEC
jgi:hypothetical protein